MAAASSSAVFHVMCRRLEEKRMSIDLCRFVVVRTTVLFWREEFLSKGFQSLVSLVLLPDGPLEVFRNGLVQSIISSCIMIIIRRDRSSNCSSCFCCCCRRFHDDGLVLERWPLNRKTKGCRVAASVWNPSSEPSCGILSPTELISSTYSRYSRKKGDILFTIFGQLFVHSRIARVRVDASPVLSG